MQSFEITSNSKQRTGQKNTKNTERQKPGFLKD